MGGRLQSECPADIIGIRILEKGTDAEHRTGSPLTLATMADTHNIRIGGYFDA
jgi:hypothetical protein